MSELLKLNNGKKILLREGKRIQVPKVLELYNYSQNEASLYNYFEAIAKSWYGKPDYVGITIQCRDLATHIINNYYGEFGTGLFNVPNTAEYEKLLQILVSEVITFHYETLNNQMRDLQ